MHTSDLAKADIRMPWLTGLHMLKEIRKEDKAMKVIMLTF